jgi:protein-tyrosine-phosphatase
MGEGLLAHHLRAAGVDVPGAVTVSSAGTHASGLPVDPSAVAALQRLGVDISAHVPRRFDRELVRADGADLVIAMTRAHLRQVAVTDRSAFARSFTLLELARRIERSGPPPEAGLAAWVANLGEGRKASALMGDDPLDDVSDPYGQGDAAVRRTADEIDRLTRSVAGALAAALRG